MRNRIRLGIGAGLAASAALTLAGCSNGSGNSASGTGIGTGIGNSANGSAMSLVADAVSKANNAGTVRITGSISGSGVSMTLSGDEQYSPSLEMSLDMQSAGQNITEIFLGDKIYMDYPGLSGELGGKKWGEIDLSEAGGSLGALSSIVNSARNENPTTQMSALLASKQITKVGTDTVEGQQTTHYSGTLNASDFLDSTAQTSQLSSAQISALKSVLQSGQVSSEKVDLWVASSGLPVQVTVAVQSSAAGAMTVTMDMSDWGAPVDVSAPPADQVSDITSLVSGAMASATANN
jgi:hypothetical protein